MIEITVNMLDGTEQNYKAPCAHDIEFIPRSVNNAVEAAIQKFPEWSSMVVVFTNPKE